ncbi:ATP-binding protein [Clostridiales bacterium F-3ap]|uniref:ATP-binding protein n=1 Tax=Anaerotalea alkaliphila TaxID=2662126 RepID=A0A7X5HVS6_9FIRM|nr:ATP-binding protein [Anaerotalea alkaliphila]
MKNRELFIKQLVQYIDTPVIKIITGIRRCGKSYLLKLLATTLRERGVESERIIQIDFESLSFEAYRHYRPLYDHIMERAKGLEGKVYILMDEIQEVEQWEKAIRSFAVDLDCDIYLTGSNAHMLSGELATYLTGRYVELELYPLSFREYLDFYDVEASRKSDVEDAFYEYVRYGGFPGLHQLPREEDIKSQYIKGIYNSVLLKDVVQRNSIRDPELLERVLVYIMDNIGQIFSAKRIADYLKSQGKSVGVESIYNYIAALENAMILYTAKRYDIKGKKILERMEKYFLVDQGLRYGMLGYRQNDIAQLLENIVFLELLRRGYRVHVGKEGDAEIDFIAEKKQEKLYIQVTYLLATEAVVEREYGPLTRTGDSHPKMVLSMDRIPVGVQGGITWMNLVDFLLE